jgi:hypothetical protein
MTNAEMKQLLSKHFPGQVELLPDAVVNELISGQQVQDVKVDGASQIDLGNVIAILTLALECIKFIRDRNKELREEHAKRELYSRVEKNYARLLNVLGSAGLRELIDDSCHY